MIIPLKLIERKKMKKIVLSLALASAMSLSALSLDSASAKASFTAYKMANKTAVPGTFKDVKFSFEKTDGTLAQILHNAKAEVNFNNIDTIKNPVRDGNIKNKLVAHLTTPKIEVTFSGANGDDKAGKIPANVSINGVSKAVEMTYEVSGGKLMAKGVLKPTDFMADAFEKFRKDPVIAGLHGKNTHDEVIIIFEAAVK